jgi:hypothetical protein
MALTVAYEYDCGYSYKTFRWLSSIAEHTGEVTWRPFSLYQVNQFFGADWLVWEHPEQETRSFLALSAAAWLQREQPDAFAAFHRRAFEIIQDEHRALDREAVLSAVKDAGADADAVAAALDDGSALRLAGESHMQLRNRYGVFGTPTIVFPNDSAMYVRIKGQWTDDEHRVRVFRMIDDVAEEHIIGEIQRPVAPEPLDMGGKPG